MTPEDRATWWTSVALIVTSFGFLGWLYLHDIPATVAVLTSRKFLWLLVGAVMLGICVRAQRLRHNRLGSEEVSLADRRDWRGVWTKWVGK